jgi:hypothetical protein
MKVLWVYYLFIVLPSAAIAIDAPPPSFIEQHSDISTWFFGLVFAGFAGLILRAINQNDKAIEANRQEHTAMLKAMEEESDKKWAAIDSLTKDLGIIVSEFNHLKGEHDAIKSFHTHRRTSDPDSCNL